MSRPTGTEPARPIANTGTGPAHQPNGAGRLPVSAFIIAKDEAGRIEAAIASVRDWADEVIVVDSGSADDTVAVAERAGARVLFNEWPGYGAQKRFGEDQCRNDWLVNIDADERVTPELAAEIRALFQAGEPAARGYRLTIVDVYPHQARPGRWAFAYDPIRLYDRRHGRFSDSPVHDSVIMNDGPIGRLTHPVLHRSIRDLSTVIAKQNRYTDMQAADARARGRRTSRIRLYLEFPLMFLKAYVLRRNVLAGTYGLALAMTYAYFRFIRLAKIYEAERMRGDGA